MASPTKGDAGDIGGKIRQAGGGIAENLLDNVADGLGTDTIEGTIVAGIADLAKPLFGAAGNAIGNAVNGDQGAQINTGGNSGL